MRVAVNPHLRRGGNHRAPDNGNAGRAATRRVVARRTSDHAVASRDYLPGILKSNHGVHQHYALV